MLQNTHVDVSPEELTEKVFIPARKGSLQLEMVGAARSYERLAVQLEPTLDAILLELQHGHPVLVLQNLGMRWLPVWHWLNS